MDPFHKLLHWSQTKFSHLPWRDENRNLYTTLVSEIMLQQTTVPTVLNHYVSFLRQFPTLHHLAKATPDEVALAWRGLGYYRRARNLHSAAQFIVEHYDGEIPLDETLLLKINGIGPYTAHALLSIGANKKALPVDANFERVLSRLYALHDELGLPLKKKLHELYSSGKILHDPLTHSPYEPRAISEAIMDLGRDICRGQNPLCEKCPLSSLCLAHLQNNVHLFPNKKQKKEKENFELELLRIVVKKNDDYLVYKKNEKQWLKGQWEVPTLVLKSTQKNFSELHQYPECPKFILSHQLIKDKIKQSKTYPSAITKYKITNTIVELTPMEFKKISLGDYFQELEFHNFNHRNKINFSSGTLKIHQKLKDSLEL
jgi:A/G-specific adenine glycosylase